MIYIKRLNFCYIRVPKNASSSIMSFLYSNACDPTNDIISRVFEWEYPPSKWLYNINCLPLPHSHIDAEYAITNNIVPATCNFFGVIRNPFEKQLSLYFYRVRVGAYGFIQPSIEDFRNRFIDGVLQDTPQQMQTQSSFLRVNNKTIGNFWLFDRIQQHLLDFCDIHNITVKSPFKVLNKSPGNKKELIEIFYDSKLKCAVIEAYKEDFEEYDRLKDFYGIR